MNTGIKVLVIDDSNTIRRSAEAYLRQAGFNVVLAEDGFDALSKISDHHPQVIFVDIMMPRLDGYLTCALIKQNPTFKTTPVIMLSARAGEEAHVDGLRAGADDYLVKPFSANELLARVRLHLENARARRQLEEQSRRLQEASVEAESTSSCSARAAATSGSSPFSPRRTSMPGISMRLISLVPSKMRFTRASRK